MVGKVIGFQQAVAVADHQYADVAYWIERRCHRLHGESERLFVLSGTAGHEIATTRVFIQEDPAQATRATVSMAIAATPAP